MKDANKILKKKIEDLEEQLLALQKAHNKLETHYHQFAKATLLCFKETAEEE